MNINCAVFDSTITNGNTTMDTKALRQKILDLAIRGKLVPQDPNDEPASVLLERIKAEKERLIKEGKIKRSKKAAKTSDTPHYGNVPFEVPSGWVWCELKELCNKFSTGPFGSMVHKSDYIDNSDYPLINPANIIDGKIDVTKAVRISADKAKELERYILEEYDILLARRGDLSKCAIVINKAIGAYCGTGSFFLHLNGMDARFFSVVYGSTYLQKILKSECVGATMDNLNQGVLENILMPYPPLSEQQRIVAEIEKWFTLIDTLEADSTNLQNLIASTKSKVLDLAIHGKLVPQDPNDEPAIELLKCINPKAEITCDNGHSEKLPSGWRLANLGMIGAWQSGGTPSRSNKSYYGGSIPWLKTGDLNDGLILDVPERITEEAVANSSAKINPTGSVLIAMYGATIGKLGILTFPATTNQACCACIEFCGITQLFLFYFLLSQRKTFVSKGGGGAQSNISKEIIVNHNISLPPLAEQQRIVQKIEDLFSILDNIQNTLEV